MKRQRRAKPQRPATRHRTLKSNPRLLMRGTVVPLAEATDGAARDADCGVEVGAAWVCDYDAVEDVAITYLDG